MARLTQKERLAALAALRLFQAGEWSCDFDTDKPDPFDERHIEGAIEKIEAGLKPQRPQRRAAQRQSVGRREV